MKEEHQIGGRYEVDVSIDLDFSDAAEHDDLNKTVDYEKVYRIVKGIITRNKFYLIERLAYMIANSIVDEYDYVYSVEVIVRKPNPPVGGPCDRAEAMFRKVASSSGT